MKTIVIAIVAVLAVAAPAQAKSAHKYTSNIQSTTLSSGNGYPGAGGTAVLVGTWDTKQFGDGAIVDHVTITGQEGNTISFRGTEFGFLPGGSLKNAFTGTSEIQPDGSQKLSVKGHWVKGTGTFRGARGTYTFSGTTQPGGDVVTGHSSGTIKF